MSEGVRGRYSQTMLRGILTSGGGSEMITALGTAGAKTFGAGTIQMTETAEKMIRPIANALALGMDGSGGAGSRALNMALGRGIGVQNVAASMAPEAIAYRSGLMATEIAEKGLIKTFGVKGASKFAMQTGSARVGMALAGEAALAAVPGLNLIFAADLAYQLAKLGGLAVKGAINFGKDAMKSMQGNINGGMFGTYKDDEVRATSRARGVMAIQNSRLNARSLLGSEGAMMAAHFG